MKTLFLVFFLYCFVTTGHLTGQELPVNALQESLLGDWWIKGPLKENESEFNIVGKIEKDPLNYFSVDGKTTKLKKIKIISSSIKYGGQLIYQLYDEFDNGDILYAFSYLEAKTEIKKTQFYINSASISSIEAFINGKSLVKHFGNGGQIGFTADLKKGNNIILLKLEMSEYSPKLYNAYPRFFLWAMPKESVKIFGSATGLDGKKLTDRNVTIYDGYQFHNVKTDQFGSFEKLFYPFQNYYQASLFDASKNLQGHSKTVKVKAGGAYKLDLKVTTRNVFTGTTKNVDGNTPQAGIRVRLESITGKENYNNWMDISDENGTFLMDGIRNGSFYISYYSDFKRNYLTDKNGNKKVYIFKGNSSYKEDIKVSKQVKGSWKNINLFEGMLSSAVYDLLLSTNGKLYIATFNGLSIYDGQNVVSYNYKNGLPNDALSCLFEDNDGNIWLGYNFSGAVKWNNGIVEKFNFDNGLVGNRVSAINQDKDGNILFGTDRGLSILNGDTFKNYNYSDGLGNGSITAIEVDGKNIWIGQNWPGGKLTLFNGNTFKNFDIPFAHQYGMNISSLTMDNDGNLWIGDNNRGLIRYDGESFRRWSIKEGIAGTGVLDIFIEDNNEIWIATTYGVSVFNGENFKTIHDFGNSLALNSGEVTSIEKSKDGIYFFGQDVRGVIVYDPNSLRNIEKADGVKEGRIGNIAYDNLNRLWISQFSGKGGVHRIEDEQVVEEINFENGLPSSQVTDFDFASDGKMWIATSEGLAVCNLESKIIKKYGKEQGLQNSNIRSLAIDKNDVVWLYTPSGLIRYDGDVFTLYNQDDGLVRPRLNGDVNIDVKGNIIYSTYGSGFSIFNGKNFINYDETNGMVDSRIWDLGIDSKNNYWLALDGSGVQSFDGESFVHYDVEDGVGAGETWSVYVDDFDMVWIGTFHGGACMFDGAYWNCIDQRDGLIENTISSIFGSNGNRVWLGGFSGLTTYIPKREISEVYFKSVVTPQKTYKGENLLSNNYEIESGNRITFGLNSNSFNTLEEKQKYIVSINFNGMTRDTLIQSNYFDFIGNKTGNYQLSFKSIDRDLNYSNQTSIRFAVIGPWYVNPATAVPFWGVLAILILFSGYTTNKYLAQRRYTLSIKEESQKRDRQARKDLEEKNSELLESQKAAEAANEAKSTFLANMSHELRTPLNAIIGYSEMLIEDAEDENEDFIPDLDKINSSGKHLLGLINDILDLSKVESGKMELFIEDFNLEKILNEVVSTIAPLVEKNGNTLKLQVETKTEDISADITKIRQILLNLLSNATKFTKEGEINIVVTDNPDNNLFLDFKVSDSGIGMTPAQVEKVFQPFTQADEKTTRKFGGTGLGLTITKMFAEMMGGSIKLSSVINQGTTFTVSIPKEVIDPKKIKGQIEEVLTSEVSSNFSVLVIDDDPNAQNLMKKFLKKENYNVLQATSGPKGLDLAAKHLPNLITLDVMMPEMDGWEVLTALQNNETTKNIPVIMLTMTNERDIGYSLGATDYLTKPVDWNNLSKILKKHEIETDSQSILIVEDDEITRDMLTKSLETNDFKVIIAKNGKEALGRVNKAKPALILLDLMMPEMDGFEFAEKLREKKEWLDIPVVVITAKDLTKEDHNRLKGNVEAIMQKGSYNKDELLSEVGDRIKILKEKG